LLYQLIFIPPGDAGCEEDCEVDECDDSPVFVMDEPSPSARSANPTFEDLAREHSSVAASVSSILFITPDVSYLVLEHFKWDRDRATATFPDQRSSVLAELGIPESRVGDTLSTREIPGDSFCLVCQEDELFDVELRDIARHVNELLKVLVYVHAGLANRAIAIAKAASIIPKDSLEVDRSVDWFVRSNLPAFGLVGAVAFRLFVVLIEDGRRNEKWIDAIEEWISKLPLPEETIRAFISKRATLQRRR
jgi:hypothetical protein